jgi:hypothetical protein
VFDESDFPFTSTPTLGPDLESHVF